MSRSSSWRGLAPQATVGLLVWVCIVEWNTALAGPDPIPSYEIRAGRRVLASLPFRPQLSEAPLWAAVDASDTADGAITVVASAQLPRSKA